VDRTEKVDHSPVGYNEFDMKKMKTQLQALQKENKVLRNLITR